MNIIIRKPENVKKKNDIGWLNLFSLDIYSFIWYNKKQVSNLSNTIVTMRKRLFILIFTLCFSIIFLPSLTAEEVLKIGKLEFEGNETFSDDILRSFARLRRGTQFDEFSVKAGKRRIENFYKSQGFLDVALKWERRLEGNEVNNIVHIQEGERAVIDTVIFNGNTFFSDEKLLSLSHIKAGDFLIQNEIFTTKYSILKVYSRKGYIRTQVVSDTLQERKNHYILTFDIVEGSRVYIGAISITGTRKVRKKIIEREIKVKPGNPCNPERVNESQIGIYSTGLFESVKYDIIEPVDGDTANIIFYVKERPSKTITFSTGYVYSDKNPNRLFLKTTWRHNNLWGNAQKIGISPRYETNFSGYRKGRIELAYEEPYFLGTTFKGGLNLFIQREKRDGEGVDVIGSNVNVGKYWSRYAQGVLRYQYEDVITRDNDTTERWVSSVSLSFSYDRKNDIFYPSKGVVFLATHQYAGGMLGGDVDYHKILIEHILYGKVFPGVIATRVKAGCIWNDRNMPFQDKFAIGGMGSVRGFYEESIGPIVNGRRNANLMIVVNCEFRLPVFERFDLVYFFDTGGLWKDFQSVSITENTGTSGGVGIGYRSPIGPIKLDYAHRLNGPSGGNFYFTIGYMF